MVSLDFFLVPTVLVGVLGFLSLLLFVSFFLILHLFFRTKKLEERQRLFLKGKNGADLESVILRHEEEVGNLDKEIQELFDISGAVRKLAESGIHKVGIVRFNPFQDTGGNQSWSIALLNGSDTGIVVSSLLSRESSRVYAKPVVLGNAKEFPFTQEEKHAIELARKPKEKREGGKEGGNEK